MPLRQVCPAAQTLPHAPQLFASDVVSTHVPLHFVSVAPVWGFVGHELDPDTHLPAEQVSPAAALQTLPHAPQLFASVCVFTD